MRINMRTLAIAAVAALCGAATGVALASIPDASNTIHACYKTVGGTLRVIDPSVGDSCKSSETDLSWQTVPPQGLSGATGPDGPKGATGVKGATGAAGPNAATLDPSTMGVIGSVSAADQIGGFFTSLTCPDGTKALSGGWEFSLFQDPKPPPMAESWPIGDDEWGFAVEADSGSVSSAAFVSLTCIAVN